MSALKLTRIGNSVGVILPKEILTRLKLEKGDTLYLTESQNGITLSPNDPDFETQMKAARSLMKKRRAVLSELAK
ncbi:MAG: AbrB/MazE/SpoVT family DNA-binding domain-containing protein [Betaproteobacteria bacterium]|nr:AbrB/MazE/SpoVT family DNA-binding domain-containing protein [Betaproteobacteria bacterium]